MDLPLLQIVVCLVDASTVHPQGGWAKVVKDVLAKEEHEEEHGHRNVDQDR